MNLSNSIWNGIFFAGFVAYLTIRHRFAGQAQREAKSYRGVDRQEKWLLASVIGGSILLPLLYLFTPLIDFAEYRLPRHAPWFGTGVMLFSLWLFWRSHADLGKNWSVSLELREQHQLVTHGVYRRIRHPMYASIWLWGIAQALMLENWLAGWSSVVPFAVMYFLRTPREERMMRDFFGQEYIDYTANTGRLFPRLKRKPQGLARNNTHTKQ